MLSAALHFTDAFLRGVEVFHPARPHERRWWWLVLMIAIGGALYGGVMGTFVLDTPQRCWQVLFSAVKVPLLLLATTTLCLPAFFVANTALGLRDDLRAAVQALLAGQAALAVALASLAPITHFWYWSEDSYRGALLFNAGVFLLATVAGQVVIRRYYAPLIRANSRHRWMLGAWFVLYAFVGIQMGWTLRPFVGAPTQVVTFFRTEPFTNAYMVVFELLFGR